MLYRKCVQLVKNHSISDIQLEGITGKQPEMWSNTHWDLGQQQTILMACLTALHCFEDCLAAIFLSIKPPLNKVTCLRDWQEKCWLNVVLTFFKTLFTVGTLGEVTYLIICYQRSRKCWNAVNGYHYKLWNKCSNIEYCSASASVQFQVFLFCNSYCYSMFVELSNRLSFSKKKESHCA